MRRPCHAVALLRPELLQLSAGGAAVAPKSSAAARDGGVRARRMTPTQHTRPVSVSRGRRSARTGRMPSRPRAVAPRCRRAGAPHQCGSPNSSSFRPGRPRRPSHPPRHRELEEFGCARREGRRLSTAGGASAAVAPPCPRPWRRARAGGVPRPRWRGAVPALAGCRTALQPELLQFSAGRAVGSWNPPRWREMEEFGRGRRCSRWRSRGHSLGGHSLGGGTASGTARPQPRP